MNNQTDSETRQDELSIMWRVLIVIALLIVFWFIFSVAALQNTTIKRLEDTDFRGYSLFSLIATVEDVDAALATIKKNDEEIGHLNLEYANTTIDVIAFQNADFRLNQAYRAIFSEFLTFSDNVPLAANSNINKAVVGEAVSLDTVKAAEAELPAASETGPAGETGADAEAPSQPPAPATPVPGAAGGNAPSVAAASTVCPSASLLYRFWAEANQNIPASSISDVVQQCLLSEDRKRIPTALVDELVEAQKAALKVRAEDNKTETKLAAISNKIEVLGAINIQLKTEIGAIDSEPQVNTEASAPEGEQAEEVEPQPDARGTLTPLQLRNLFPEISDFLSFIGFGRGLKLQPELVLGLLTSIAGAVGGTSKYALGRFSAPLAGTTPIQLPTLFIPTLFSASFAGLAVFLILFGGLAVFQAGGPGDSTSANYSSFAAFGFLSGMFSDRVNSWLESIAGNVFSNAGKAAQAAAEAVRPALQDGDVAAAAAAEVQDEAGGGTETGEQDAELADPSLAKPT